MKPNGIASLVEFIEHVDSLRTKRFAKACLSGSKVSMSGNASGSFQIDNLDEEDFQSFLLGVRFLVQNNEKISVRNVCQLVDASRVDSKVFERINGARWKLNDFLDRETFPAPGEGEISFREYLETFLYGKYAHRSRKYQQRLDAWQKDQVQYLMLKLNFLVSLNVVLKCAGEIADALRDWISAEQNSIEGIVPPLPLREQRSPDVVSGRIFKRRRSIGHELFNPTPAMREFVKNRSQVYQTIANYAFELGDCSALNPHNELPDSLGSGKTRSPEGETLRGEIVYSNFLSNQPTDLSRSVLFEVTYGDKWETVVYLSGPEPQEEEFVLTTSESIEQVLASVKRRRQEILGVSEGLVDDETFEIVP